MLPTVFVVIVIVVVVVAVVVVVIVVVLVVVLVVVIVFVLGNMLLKVQFVELSYFCECHTLIQYQMVCSK